MMIPEVFFTRNQRINAALTAIFTLRRLMRVKTSGSSHETVASYLDIFDRLFL